MEFHNVKFFPCSFSLISQLLKEFNLSTSRGLWNSFSRPVIHPFIYFFLFLKEFHQSKSRGRLNSFTQNFTHSFSRPGYGKVPKHASTACRQQTDFVGRRKGENKKMKNKSQLTRTKKILQQDGRFPLCLLLLSRMF